VKVRVLFLRGRRKLNVNLGELKTERESLSGFLSSKLKVDLSSSANKLFVYSDSLSSNELKRLVNKFVYQHHLNHTYWVVLESNGVKIHKFKRAEKKVKQNERIIPSTIKHAGRKEKNSCLRSGMSCQIC